jgi:hypothetical protein
MFTFNECRRSYIDNARVIYRKIRWYNSVHYPSSCPLFKTTIQTETSSIYWSQLSRFHMKTEKKIQSPTHRVLNTKIGRWIIITNVYSFFTKTIWQNVTSTAILCQVHSQERKHSNSDDLKWQAGTVGLIHYQYSMPYILLIADSCDSHSWFLFSL